MLMEDAQRAEFIRSQIQKRVEDLFEGYVEKHKMRNGEYIEGVTIAPKSLNLKLSAVKGWLLYKRVISNTRQFRQIKFDKTSRATRDKQLILTKQFKRMCDHADIREKCVIGLYGIHGVRPSLIPQLLLEDIKSPKDAYTPLLINGIPNPIQLEEFTWIMVKKEYEGNKGNCDFPIILTSETAEWISQHLNQRVRRGEKLTLDSQLVKVPSKKSVDDIVDKLFEVVGFKGRNYLLRHFANKLLKSAHEDKDFKEWCMGHSGDISDVYDHEHGLNEEEIAEYNASIDMSKLRVYGATSDEMKDARLMVNVAKKLSYSNMEELDKIVKLLEVGKMTFEQFEEQLTGAMQDAQRRAIKREFAMLMEEYQRENGRDKAT